MSKIVVYTALFTDDITQVYGGLPEYDDNSVDYICFTNTPHLKSNTWDIRLIEVEESSRKSARKCKMMPHKLLPEYSGWIWMDNSCIFKYNPKDLYDFYNSNSDIAVHEHCDRRNIIEEANILISRGIDDSETIMNQLSGYISEGYKDQGLFETGILFRENNSKVNKFNEMWWVEVSTKSVRDQLSFSYIVWKCKDIKINAIKETFVAHRHVLGKQQSEHFYTIPRKSERLI